MQELIIGLIGAAAGLILFRMFDKKYVDNKQKKLESEVSRIKQDQARLEGAQAEKDKQTQEKVDEIDKEKSRNISGNDLASWFSRRGKK